MYCLRVYACVYEGICECFEYVCVCECMSVCMSESVSVGMCVRACVCTYTMSVETRDKHQVSSSITFHLNFELFGACV